MAETKLAFALAGLDGFNAHGAGFLQAARDNEIEPDLVTATSGQIVVLAAYLPMVDANLAHPIWTFRVEPQNACRKKAGPISA